MVNYKPRVIPSVDFNGFISEFKDGDKIIYISFTSSAGNYKTMESGTVDYVVPTGRKARIIEGDGLTVMNQATDKVGYGPNIDSGTGFVQIWAFPPAPKAGEIWISDWIPADNNFLAFDVASSAYLCTIHEAKA